MDTGNSLKVGARLCFGLSQGKLQHSPWPWKTLEIPHTCQKFIPFMLCQPSFGLFSAQVTVSRAIVLWQRLPAMARANLIRTYRFDTLPKRNIAPEKCRLEGEISFWEGIFSSAVFQWGYTFCGLSSSSRPKSHQHYAPKPWHVQAMVAMALLFCKKKCKNTRELVRSRKHDIHIHQISIQKLRSQRPTIHQKFKGL